MTMSINITQKSSQQMILITNKYLKNNNPENKQQKIN